MTKRIQYNSALAMKINFAKQAYQSRSKPLNAQRLVNYYLEPAPEDSKSPDVLIGTPGLVLFADISASRIWGMHVMGSLIYAVIGDFVYTINSSGGGNNLGTIGTVSDVVIMSNNGTYVIIVKEDGATYYADASSLTQITDGDFESASSVCVIDGYGIFTRKDTNEFALSLLNNIAAYDALDFANAEQNPDLLVRAFALKGLLWLFGELSIEIWQNTGSGDFAFSPMKNATITRGCAAKRSVATEDNTIFWLGDDRIIYRAKGYSPERISTYAIEKAIGGYTTISDAESFCYTQEGHKFLVMTFPTELVTWVCDLSTMLWHQRQSFEKGRWRASSYAFFQGKNLVGDFETGKIYELDLDAYTENGDILQAIAVSPPVFKDKAKLIHDKLWIDFDAGQGLVSGYGSDPHAMLRFSDDGSNTWSNEKSRPMGAIGKYQTQVAWTSLGQARERIYEVNVTAPVNRNITGAYANIRVCNA